jgi:gliding motility-associatede transport system auxiliary component
MLKRVLGLLGWLGVALVFAAVAIRFTKPEWQQWYNGLAMAGLACTLLYILSQWREIARSFSGRQARLGSLAAASVVVVLGILIAINYLASRHDKRWDLTAAKQFSLSDQTKKVLQGLQKPVRVRVFGRSEDFPRFRERLDEYQYQSKQLNVEYIDLERNPARANEYKPPIQNAGTVVFEYEGRNERVTSDGEQDLTNGLIKVIQGKQHKVYFVQGHGEHTTDTTDRSGYSSIGTALKSDNFDTDSIVLAQQKDVPADASVLVVAGPRTDFFPAEIDMLKKYLAKGGKVFFMLDPPERADAPPMTNLLGLIKDWGIDVGNNIVVDVSGMGQLLGTSESVPVAAKYDPHPITDRFNLLTAYPVARSVSAVEGGANGHTAQNLVETSRNSWAETDIKRLITSGQVERELDKGDKGGPISLAAVVSAPATDVPAAATDQKDPKTAADAPKPESRLAVFGDSDFVSNGFLGIPGNRDLFLNTVNWLAQQENLISIRPKDPEDRRVSLTADQAKLIFWLAIVIIPGFILAAGVQTWWRRR